MKIIQLFLLLITASFFPSSGEAFLGIGSGYDKRGEHCDGICNIVEYNCDAKNLTLITPFDMGVRDAHKLPRVLTQKYLPSEMRNWCKKNCFHKMPWKAYKNNPEAYFDTLCAPSKNISELEALKVTSPLLAPEQYFHFRNHLPESATLLNLKTMDESFLKETKDIKRAVGAVEFVALIHEVLVNSTSLRPLSERQMTTIAQNRMHEELLKAQASQSVIEQYKAEKVIPLHLLAAVLHSLKTNIFTVKGVRESDIKIPQY